MSKKILLVTVLLLVGLALLTGAALAKKTPLTEDTLIWNLSQTKIIDPGQTVRTPEGALLTGYTLEAKAKSQGGVVPNGVFRLSLTAFAPDRDMPGQTAGQWYVQGEWTLVDARADQQSLKTRHNPFRVSGKIQAVLPFNPAAGEGGWSARAWLPMSIAAGQWARSGEGSLTFDAGLSGGLSLPVELWPEMK